MNHQEALALLNRVQGLSVGLIGEIPGSARERTVMGGGSAIFVAPNLVLTATHVLNGLFQITDDLPAGRLGHFNARHGLRLFRAFPGNEVPRALWNGVFYWTSPWCDLALVKVTPAGSAEFPRGALSNPTGFLPWTVMPPEEGALVRLFGYPQTQPSYSNDALDFEGRSEPREARVTKVYPLGHDRGLYPAPCFEIDISVDHGFSGGGVFFEDALCGVVWGGIGFGRGTMISTLWPLALMRLQDQADSERRRLGDLFGATFIDARDWASVQYRLSVRCTEDREYVTIDGRCLLDED